jgi:hypothetical protein
VATGKKNAARLRAHLVFPDETGFLLLPPVRKTWAPRGQTPVLRHWTRRDKRSVISAITVSPRRRHLGLYFQLHPAVNIRQPAVIAFLRHLLRHLRGPLIILWDGGGPHTGQVLRAWLRRTRRVHLEPFPAYAPELNPDEGIHRLTKRLVANGRPDDLRMLTQRVRGAHRRVGRSQALLRSCVRHAGLPFSCPDRCITYA